MLYLYIKALHIIFIVTWFAALFYTPRLFIYYKEAEAYDRYKRDILQQQFLIMIKRLWLGIAWPSALLTLIFGGWLFLLQYHIAQWLILKLCFVTGLYLYHLWLNRLYHATVVRHQQRYSSTQLRYINEISTMFLIIIVFIVILKDTLNWFWFTLLLCFIIIGLILAIRIYKKLRNANR